VGLAAAGGSLLLALLLLLLRRRRMQRPRHKPELGIPLLQSFLDTSSSSTPHGAVPANPLAALGSGSGSGGGGRGDRSCAFSEAQIQAFTGNFAEGNKLAQGSYGTVYRGTMQLPGSAAHPRAVAVKVLTKRDGGGGGGGDGGGAAAAVDGTHDYSGFGSFALEAKVLGQHRHQNLVRLLGHCLDRAQPRQYLVFEFVGGGSLYERLGAECGAPPLTWQQRFAIASDVARGLEYLHVEADPPIIHQDVKTENILLAEQPPHGGGGNGGGGTGGGGRRIVAKLCDFGAVRVAPDLLTGTHVSALSVIGTRPYQPPEYVTMGHVSEKTDAFAFGVVLLELLTAKPPSNEAGAFLSQELAPALDAPERQLPPHFDARAPGACPTQRALQLARVARRCLEMQVHKRCTVSDVLVELDVLAGRQALRRAGRGEEYDPMTGELVQLGPADAPRPPSLPPPVPPPLPPPPPPQASRPAAPPPAPVGTAPSSSPRAVEPGACSHCGTKLRYRQGVALACFTCRK
jgi:serine/threonine protein kinase